MGLRVGLDKVRLNGIATQFGLKDKIIVTFTVGDAEIRKRCNKSLNPSSSLYGLIKGLNRTRPEVSSMSKR